MFIQLLFKELSILVCKLQAWELLLFLLRQDFLRYQQILEGRRLLTEQGNQWQVYTHSLYPMNQITGQQIFDIRNAFTGCSLAILLVSRTKLHQIAAWC